MHDTIIGYSEEATRYKWLIKEIEVYAYKLSTTFLYVYIVKYSLNMLYAIIMTSSRDVITEKSNIFSKT